MRTCLLTLAIVIGGHALADPIHARADGAYWHHDSGWVFPEKIAGFERVGVPQDVAGSRDAVAWYAYVADGTRTVASVDVIAPDSAAGDASRDATRRAFERELPPGAEPVADAVCAAECGLPRPSLRIAYLVTRDGARQLLALYHVDAGPWRVVIHVTAPRANAVALARLDTFVRDQRWDTLPSCDASMASSVSCAACAGAASSP